MSLRYVNIIFAEKNREFIECMNKCFGDMPNVTISRSDTLQIQPADCVVYPGNSYGLLDDAYGNSLDVMLDGVSRKIRTCIDNLYLGEQPVGSCILVKSNDKRYVYVAHAPIMHTQTSNINKTNNIYYAFRAVLLQIINHNRMYPDKITTVLCPSMYTNLNDKNGMPLEEVVKQMFLAYIMVNNPVPCSYDSQSYMSDLL